MYQWQDIRLFCVLIWEHAVHSSAWLLISWMKWYIVSREKPLLGGNSMIQSAITALGSQYPFTIECSWSAKPNLFIHLLSILLKTSSVISGLSSSSFFFFFFSCYYLHIQNKHNNIKVRTRQFEVTHGISTSTLGNNGESTL